MARFFFRLAFVALLLLPGIAALPTARAQTDLAYTLELVPPLEGDDSSVAFAISAGGWVTGISIDSTGGGNRVIRYRDGETRDRSDGNRASRGFAINKSAQIAGFFANDAGGSVAAMWDGSEITELPTLGGANGQAFGINDDGIVVGGSQKSADGPIVACKWVDGEPVELPSLGGISLGLAINASGQIAGQASTSADPTAPGAHAVLWDGEEMIDLGTLGGQTSLGRSINDAGQIVGHSTTGPDDTFGADGTHAFLWSDGEMTDLGTLPGGSVSNGWDINNHGVIAGSAQLPAADGGSPQLTAVLWIDGEIVDLNTLLPEGAGVTLTIAYGINDAGQIVGLANDGEHTLGFVLTPAPS